MASLQKIRSHGALLIAVVGLAMLAFILGDFLNSSSSLFREDPNRVGNIAGNEVTWENIENTRAQLEQLKKAGAELQFRQSDSTFISYMEYLNQNGIYVPEEITNEEIWESYKLYYTYLDQANKMGMSLSADEEAMLAQRFPYVPEHMVKGIYLQQKYIALMRNTFAINDLEAEFAFNAGQRTLSAEYVMMPYDAIADSLVEVSESDIKALYNKHKAQLKQQPNRTIEYAVINYVPSEMDFIKEAENMANLQEDFATADDIDDLLRYHDSDEQFQVVTEYNENTVPAEFKEFAFNKDAKINDCSELQFDGKAYALARIIDINKANKTVSLAILKRTVIPSDATKAEMEQQYNKFLNENNDLDLFEQAARENGLNLRVATVQELTQKVNGIQDSRKIVQWAFKASEGAVSKEVFECSDQLVVAAIVEANNDAYVSLEKVRSYLTIEAMNEAKAAYIAENYTGKTLADAAQAWGQSIQLATAVTLADNTFGAYPEPAVVGKAFAIAEDEVSAPIKGNMGVYVIKVGVRSDVAEDFTEEAKNSEKMALSRSLNTKFQQAVQALQEAADAKIYNPERL